MSGDAPLNMDVLDPLPRVHFFREQPVAPAWIPKTRAEYDTLWGIASDEGQPVVVREQAWQAIRAYERKEAEEDHRRWQAELRRHEAAKHAEAVERVREHYRLREPINRKTQETIERRAPIRKAALKRFGGGWGRRLWAYQEHQKGRTFAEIAAELGVSRDRAGQLVRRAEREIGGKMRRARMVSFRPDGTAGRPIDMGGPRDVWLEYGVAADPRLDNMYPVVR